MVRPLGRWVGCVVSGRAAWRRCADCQRMHDPAAGCGRPAGLLPNPPAPPAPRPKRAKPVTRPVTPDADVTRAVTSDVTPSVTSTPDVTRDVTQGPDVTLGVTLPAHLVARLDAVRGDCPAADWVAALVARSVPATAAERQRASRARRSAKDRPLRARSGS